MSIIDELPMNDSRIYVMEKDKSGCEIYVPVSHEQYITIDKLRLRRFLANQPGPHTFNFPPKVA